MEKNYKKPLKNCRNCKRLNFVINKGKKEEYCTIFGNKFKSSCEKKRGVLNDSDNTDNR